MQRLLRKPGMVRFRAVRVNREARDADAPSRGGRGAAAGRAVITWVEVAHILGRN
jgi:hypothetical protein